MLLNLNWMTIGFLKMVIVLKFNNINWDNLTMW